MQRVCGQSSQRHARKAATRSPAWHRGESVPDGLCLWRKAVFVWAHLNATRQGHAARSSQPSAEPRSRPAHYHPVHLRPSYVPPPVPQSFAPRPSPPHTRSLKAHAYTTLVTKLDSLLQLNMENGASSDPPSPKSAPCLPCPEQQRSQEDSAPETRQHQTRHPAGSAPWLEQLAAVMVLQLAPADLGQLN